MLVHDTDEFNCEIDGKLLATLFVTLNHGALSMGGKLGALNL